MLIAIDIGNSRIKAGVFINKILYKTFDSLSESELIKLVNEYPDFAVYVCAVSKIPPHFLNLIVNKHRLVQVSYLTNIPLKINYHTPDKLGIDRLVGSVGAWSIFTGKNILIVDIGTCVTYDFVSENGYYLGGAISPGLLIRAKALNSFTEKLPLVNINLEEPNLIGNSTEACIKAGLVLGLKYEIQGFISAYKKKNNDLVVVLTGGDASFFESLLETTIFVDPNLILKGLHYIFINNEEKYFTK
jgi:type III pantothenate kinase